MKSKGFEGVWIPKSVFMIEELTFNQKVIFAMIQNLSSDQPCFASNHYIGKQLNISERQVSRQISVLKSKNFIHYKHPRKISGEWERREITVRHKTHWVESLPKVSSGHEETHIPKVSTNNKVLYNKVYNKGNLDKSKEVIKEREVDPFIKFWKTIPSIRRINKVRTKKNWLLATQKESAEVIQKAMELFVERVEPQYIKTSYAWLSEERWKSIPPEQPKVNKGFVYVN